MNQRKQLQPPHPQQTQKRYIQKYKRSNMTCPARCADSFQPFIPIMRRPFYPQGKGEEASFPTLFPNKLLQAALSQSLPSVSIHEKVHPGFLGNPTFLVIEIWQRGPWEVATTSAPPPFFFKTSLFRAQSFLPAPVLSYWSLT